VVENNNIIDITDDGESSLIELAYSFPKFWHNQRRCQRLVKQALTAIHSYKRDQQYLVNDGKVQIIDEATGLVMADRSW
jgi:preprotein translocase subunit SecA